MLGVLVFVHELGHFLAAKRVGIRVLKFQLGFNPTILSFRRGDTEYGIGALPLGGYVKMAGENPDEPRTGRDDEFLSKSKWQRFFVLIMGPVMNVLLAFVLTAVVLYQGLDVLAYEDQPPVVGAVAVGTPAAKSDIQPGDRILSVNGHSVETWTRFSIEISSHPSREVTIQLLRNGQELTRKVTPTSVEQNRFTFGDIGVLPIAHPHIVAVFPGDPAFRAGLKAGDVVIAIDGETITFRTQLQEAIARHADRPITLTIERAGQQLVVPVTPANRDGNGWLGISILDDVKSIKPTALGAIKLSFEKNVEFSGLIFRTVWGLITRETSPKQLMGPVAIAQLSGESAQLGWIALLSLMASISLNLGLLNLLPIPILDGGHIFIMALEGVAGRDFSVRVKEKLLLAGLVVLMMLMVTVIYNDLARISWIGRLMPWK